jgi:hypothetical protein
MRSVAAAIVSNQKVVGSFAANAAGLQVGRILLFRLAMMVGRWRHGIRLPARLAALDRDGMALLPDYLSGQEFAELRAAFQSILADAEHGRRKKYAGDDHVDITLVPLTRAAIATYPVLRRIFDSPEIAAAFSYLSGKRVEVNEIVLELVRHRASEKDPETVLHADTFFPNQNAWLFVEDVELACGPFVYAPGSHRLTPTRLLFQYLASLRHFRGESGSPRISDRFARLLGLAAKPCAVPRNTLAISNNFGFHARGVGQGGTIRAGFKLSSKETPFSRQTR